MWLLIAAVLTAGFADVSVRPAGSRDQLVTISGFDAEQTSLIESALARFDVAQLDLPRVHIRFSKGADECTRRGRAAETWPVALMEVCVVNEAVVLHELSHVWAFGHLDGGDRDAWNQRRGTPTWRSRDHPWHSRGAEHAADILTWYLYWADLVAPQGRIAGDLGPDRFLADIEWLLHTAEADAALVVYDDRVPAITLSLTGVTG